ncbi:hypothetical protein A1F94_013779 [Pyrenophora tritici-repentis]|uniref:Uncharacterized protein n=2 Tax=Pyrenophora tritici-repentis TaxID=45151 RepID=B2WJT2_PYRTR|nr:uncharacterized protein PTRG_10429 [Pyrenophora tritici-repentis Pt-1C-BFP]KAF7450313.1 hypothetical protein A1F99_049290 [Pyrenophora tritici-repentis]EDU43479.1 predicted protein [Pyrenophora tritici-repentis Pt-1C-BFP]KAG9375641.1 hypothetical protein A1F94_013779 [Pyrenophora tritici-repentis]KAI1523195.1 hypothetical protein PtrSN001C_011547 [Pyrenophora tritici-repentis]KAI1592747.1 hypothetical protein PtrCC142_011546 [Pyrenophora tritici-repentis]
MFSTPPLQQSSPSPLLRTITPSHSRTARSSLFSPLFSLLFLPVVAAPLMPGTTRGKAAQRSNAEHARNSKIAASGGSRSAGAPRSAAGDRSEPEFRRRTASPIKDDASPFTRSSVKKQFNSQAGAPREFACERCVKRWAANNGLGLCYDQANSKSGRCEACKTHTCALVDKSIASIVYPAIKQGIHEQRKDAPFNIVKKYRDVVLEQIKELEDSLKSERPTTRASEKAPVSDDNDDRSISEEEDVAFDLDAYYARSSQKEEDFDDLSGEADYTTPTRKTSIYRQDEYDPFIDHEPSARPSSARKSSAGPSSARKPKRLAVPDRAAVRRKSVQDFADHISKMATEFAEKLERDEA